MVGCAVGLVLLPLACVGGDGDEEDKPISATPRVTTAGGETSVTLDAATLARAGLVIVPLSASSHRAEIVAYGSVLDLTELADARGAAAGAAARASRAEAALHASRAEFERTRTLRADDGAASDKALEAARAAFEADTSELSAARAAVATLEDAAAQRWGGVIAGWLASGSPRLDALLQQKERLARLTLPPGTAMEAPPATAVLRAGDAAVTATLVSPAPRTDPRIQGVSLFFAAPASPSLQAGTNLTGSLGVGAVEEGVVVPAGAVVWWRGRAWVYVEKGTGSFVRREVPTDAPTPDGWFAAKGLGVGERVVVEGAQLLLSEEGRGAVHGSEG